MDLNKLARLAHDTTARTRPLADPGSPRAVLTQLAHAAAALNEAACRVANDAKGGTLSLPDLEEDLAQVVLFVLSLSDGLGINSELALHKQHARNEIRSYGRNK